MEILIWAGAGVTLLGLALLVWCIVRVAAARRAGLPESELRARLQRIVTLNLGALLLSAFGLVLVITGIALG